MVLKNIVLFIWQREEGAFVGTFKHLETKVPGKIHVPNVIQNSLAHLICCIKPGYDIPFIVHLKHTHTYIW